MEAASPAMNDDFLSGLDDEARRAADAVIDLDAEENSCPACGDAWTSVPQRCPSCGLRIS